MPLQFCIWKLKCEECAYKIQGSDVLHAQKPTKICFLYGSESKAVRIILLLLSTAVLHVTALLFTYFLKHCQLIMNLGLF